MSLEIIDLHVEVEGKEIIKGISLEFKEKQVHALLGPNGSGKSSLAFAMMGHPKYKITKGKILLNGEDITNVKPDARAKKGLFLSFQYPQAVEGVTISKFLRQAVNSVSEKKYSVPEFHELLKEKMKLLKIDPSFNRRYLNKGFSGGEKKRMEVLQLLLLEPKFAFLDETDSGLDVDAIKVVAQGINLLHTEKKMSIIIITHYNKFLQYFSAEMVTVMHEGKIVAQGEKELADKIEQEGFETFIQ